VLEIAEEVSDPRIKLDAIRVANECYKIIMDLCSNASVVEQALKFVQQKTEQLDKIQTIKMLDERIEASEEERVEEETTANGVF